MRSASKRSATPEAAECAGQEQVEPAPPAADAPPPPEPPAHPQALATVVDSGAWLPQENNSPVMVLWEMVRMPDDTTVFDVRLRWTLAVDRLGVQQAQNFLNARLSQSRPSVPFSVKSQVARTPFLTGAFEWRQGRLWVVDLAYPGAMPRSSCIR